MRCEAKLCQLGKCRRPGRTGLLPRADLMSVVSSRVGEAGGEGLDSCPVEETDPASEREHEDSEVEFEAESGGAR